MRFSELETDAEDLLSTLRPLMGDIGDDSWKDILDIVQDQLEMTEATLRAVAAFEAASRARAFRYGPARPKNTHDFVMPNSLEDALCQKDDVHASHYRALMYGIEYMLSTGRTHPEIVSDAGKDDLSFAMAIGIILQDFVHTIYIVREIKSVLREWEEPVSQFTAAGTTVTTSLNRNFQHLQSEQTQIVMDLWHDIEPKAQYFLGYVPHTLRADCVIDALTPYIVDLEKEERDQIGMSVAIIEGQRLRYNLPRLT